MKKNNENGIPFEDFKEKYWQNLVDDMQKLLDDLDMSWTWQYSDIIGKYYRDKFNNSEITRDELLDAQHHINNILQHIQIEIENILSKKNK